MFWKKRKKENTDPFGLEFELDRRLFYRVQPADDRPVYFEEGGRQYRVVDISAGGLSFAAGRNTTGRLRGVIRLPDNLEPVPVIFQAVDCSPAGVCRGEIAKVRPRDRERLHYYVLKRQKDQLSQHREPEQDAGLEDEAEAEK